MRDDLMVAETDSIFTLEPCVDVVRQTGIDPEKAALVGETSRQLLSAS